MLIHSSVDNEGCAVASESKKTAISLSINSNTILVDPFYTIIGCSVSSFSKLCRFLHIYLEVRISGASFFPHMY